MALRYSKLIYLIDEALVRSVYKNEQVWKKGFEKWTRLKRYNGLDKWEW